MPTGQKTSMEDCLKICEDYYENNMKSEEIAAKYGIGRACVYNILKRENVFRKYSERIDARIGRMQMKNNIAKLKLMEASPMAADQIIGIASQSVKETPIQYQYVIQNASADILNRVGVKPAEEESKEVHVILEGGEIEMGTPDE